MRGAPCVCTVRFSSRVWDNVPDRADPIEVPRIVEEKRTAHPHDAPRKAHRARSVLYLIRKTTMP